MTDQELLIACLKRTVFGADVLSTLFDDVPSEQWRRVYALAKTHDLSHIVAEFLSQGEYLRDETLKDQYKTEARKASYRSVTQEHELEQIKGVLEQNGIPFVVLKGAVIRDVYPSAWMRVGCDLDLLVKPQTLERAQKAVETELGYTFAGKSYHDLSLRSPGNVNLELHYSLAGDFENIDTVLKKAWDYATPVSEHASEHRLTPEFFLYHVVAHLYYHFLSGGCGIRPVMDLKLLQNRFSYDRAAFEALLETAGIMRFYEKMTDLADVWFGDRAHDEGSRLLETYILRGGVYGSLENRVLTDQSQHGRGKALLRRIVLPYPDLCHRFKKEKIRWYQVPFYQVAWWLFVLRRGNFGKSVREMQLRQTTDNAEVEAVGRLMKELGL